MSMSRTGNKRNQIYRVLIGTGMFALVVAIWWSIGLYRQRKAVETAITERSDAMKIDLEGQAAPEESVSDEGELRLDKDTITYNGELYRRNTYVKPILCMGVDRSDIMTEDRKLGAAGQADGIFLIAQDTARNSLKILMIPRDAMTEITELNPDGSEIGKVVWHLTLAYAYGDGRTKSCQNMVESTSNLLFGLPIDHYMAVDTAVISTLNDAVGGVTVTIPTSGMEKRDSAFVQGSTVTLKGEQAEAFVRYRDIERDNSALFRMDQHQEYITQYFRAIKKKSQEDSQIVPHIFDMIQDYMVTDMGKEKYLKIALDSLGSDNLEADDFYTLPGTGVVTDTYDEFYVDTAEAFPVVLNLFYRKASSQ